MKYSIFTTLSLIYGNSAAAWCKYFVTSSQETGYLFIATTCITIEQELFDCIRRWRPYAPHLIHMVPMRICPVPPLSRRHLDWLGYSCMACAFTQLPPKFALQWFSSGRILSQKVALPVEDLNPIEYMISWARAPATQGTNRFTIRPLLQGKTNTQTTLQATSAAVARVYH